MSKVLVADIQILGAAFFFGIGFIGQRAVSVDGLGPMTCNAFRFALSAVLLIILIPWIPAHHLNLLEDDHHGNGNDTVHLLPAKEDDDDDEDVDDLPPAWIGKYFGNGGINYYLKLRRTPLFWGVFLGCINFCGSGLQQWGITMTSANKVAFIAGFDLFLTPIFSLFIPTFKRNGKPLPSTWLAVSLSFVGLYLLSDADFSDLEIGKGEMLTLISTVFWTLHITYTDIATTFVDILSMMVVQLLVVAGLSYIAALMCEPQLWFWHHILLFLPWMLFLAVVEGLGFTLMALGQHYSPPTHAAIILSLEGVFASIASYFVLKETLSYHEFMGCCLMLGATFIAKMGFFGLDGFVFSLQQGTSTSSSSTSTLSSSSSTNSSTSPLSATDEDSSRWRIFCYKQLYIPYINYLTYIYSYLTSVPSGSVGNNVSTSAFCCSFGTRLLCLPFILIRDLFQGISNRITWLDKWMAGTNGTTTGNDHGTTNGYKLDQQLSLLESAQDNYELSTLDNNNTMNNTLNNNGNSPPNRSHSINLPTHHHNNTLNNHSNHGKLNTNITPHHILI